MSFSIDRFVSTSKAVNTQDLDWDELCRVGLRDEEARVLRYMASTESQVILFLRDMLAGQSARDAELTAFLSCWLYEEFSHARAVERVLTVCGHAAAPQPPSSTPAKARGAARQRLRIQLESFFSGVLPLVTPHFAALHMAWGALDEMMAAAAYTRLAERTRNRQLARLLLRVAKDERRHQAFFFSQAERRMQHPLGRLIARQGLFRLWSPLGVAMGGNADEFAFMSWLAFDGTRGAEELLHMDRLMARLPGLEDCDLAYRKVTRRMEFFGQHKPEQLLRLRVAQADEDQSPAPLSDEIYAEAS